MSSMRGPIVSRARICVPSVLFVESKLVERRAKKKASDSQEAGPIDREQLVGRMCIDCAGSLDLHSSVQDFDWPGCLASVKKKADLLLLAFARFSG